MENTKKCQGKVGLIIIIIILLGAVGYLSYDKFVNNNNQDYKSEINDLEEEIEDLKANISDNTTANTNPISGLVGKYVYEGTEEFDSPDKYTDQPEKAIVAELEIKEDGTGTYRGGLLMGDIENAKGNIALGNGKIFLMNDNCNKMIVSGVNNDECVSPNCHPIIVFDYSGDKITVAVQNNESRRVELTKQND